jgi:hypothetical protein
MSQWSIHCVRMPILVGDWRNILEGYTQFLSVAKKSVSGVGAVCIEMLDVVARDELMPHEDGGGTGLRPGRSSEGRIRPVVS